MRAHELKITIHMFERVQDLVTLDCLTVETDLTKKQALRVMDRLTREGYLEQVADNREPLKFGEYGPRRRNPTWRLVADKAVRLRPIEARKKNTARDTIWKAVRLLAKTQHRFCVRDVVQKGQVNEHNVVDYLELLERNGVIVRVPNAKRPRYWLLKNDTGPTRPITQEKPAGKPPLANSHSVLPVSTRDTAKERRSC